jgi:PmbA protein
MDDLGVAGEAYLEKGSRAKVTVCDGRVETLEDRRDLGMAIRVFASGGVGFSFTSDLSAGEIRDAITDAREIAKHIGPDEAWRLPDPEPVTALPFPNADRSVGTVDMPRRIGLAVAMEEAARQVDSRVSKTRQSAYQDYGGEAWIVSTAGLAAVDRYSRAVGYLEVTATEADRSQVGFHADFGLGPADISPEEIGERAAFKAVDKLGALPATTGRIPTVLDREVVAGLLEALSPAFSARRVIKGTSLLSDRLGETVAAPSITLVDDPRLEGGYGSSPVDGEGLATHRTVLIEEGRLRSYLHDTFSAIKLNQGPPGNSVRSSYLGPPQIGAMNLLLIPGDSRREALLERAGDGILITEVMGLHTVDPVSGDFSLGGSGRKIERGRLGPPVDKLAFSGNMLELLGEVEAVGSDLKLFSGGGGAPSLLLRSLSIAGGS